MRRRSIRQQVDSDCRSADSHCRLERTCRSITLVQQMRSNRIMAAFTSRPALIALVATRHRVAEARCLRGIQRRRRGLRSARSDFSRAWRKPLLACGIVSSLLYGAMIWAVRYEGYSLVSQVPSELSAIGAPTQRVWALLGPIYTALVTAFGWGVWKSAGGNRALRTVGGAILAYGSLGLLWPFAPMHQREALAAGGATLGDTMHVVLGAVTVFLMFL